MAPPTKSPDVEVGTQRVEERKKDSGKGTGRHRLGTILVTNGLLSPEQLAHALEQQKQLGHPLGRVLIKLNYVTDAALKKALSEQLGIPFVDLDAVVIDRTLGRLINKSYARRHGLLPVAKVGMALTVAMDDPTDTAVLTELRYVTKHAIGAVTATTQGIQRAFARLYDEEVAEATDLGSAELITPLESPSEVAPGPLHFDEQVTRQADELLRALLYRAFLDRASDLHLEMLRNELRIRYRVDGVLRQPHLGPLQNAANKSVREVISRVKILSKMDIAERRRPQDGSFQVAVERSGQKINIDLRVSVIPSYYGESVVIRILDRSATPQGLGDVGLSSGVASRMESLLRHTTGIILVTGPTGSGKSTTLYASLRHLHRPEIRIVTAEDPVEYLYDEMSQSEVNPAISNTFATYLRAFLRHDPEVIMVGEIRDQETAEMAFRAAQTGHLLLSTMHTTTALSALSRLLDLKIDPSLIASSLVGVLSQRLARKLCEGCRTPVEGTPDNASEFFTRVPKDLVLYTSRGCESCGFTGFRGRIPITDLWCPDATDMALVTRQASLQEIAESATRTSIGMAEDAYARLVAGLTTTDELLRVLPYAAIAEHRRRYSS